MKDQSSKFQVQSFKRVFLWILVFGLWSFTPQSFTQLNTYPVKANLLAVDNFSSFYTASNNSVLKFSADGTFICRYDEFKFGKIGMIDVSNPLKILVFYPDFMAVVVLDKFLSPLNTYNFFEFGYQNISAVASSVDGRIWFYDNVDFKLKKIEATGKIFRESQQLNVVTGHAPNPNFMIERDNKVYVNDTAIGILVFDIFGSYIKTIPLRGLQKFQVLQEQIVYFDSMQLNSYNPFSFETKAFPLPDTNLLKTAVLEKDRLGLLNQESLNVYKY